MRAAPGWTSLAAIVVTLAACEDITTRPALMGPFSFRVLAAVGASSIEFLGENERVVVPEGQLVLVRIQAVDRDDRATPSQINTLGRATNPRLIKRGEVFQQRENVMEFFFEAVEEGASTLVFENAQFNLVRIVIVDVVAS